MQGGPVDTENRLWWVVFVAATFFIALAIYIYIHSGFVFVRP